VLADSGGLGGRKYLFVESAALCLTITRIADFDPRMNQVLELEVPCFQ
jgi:hypothetical protein